MRKELFRTWLRKKRSERSASDCISRCKNVENSLGVDLDQEYKRDVGKSVLNALNYGKKQADQGEKVPQPFSFSTGCNSVQRFTDLRCSVKQYFVFCSEQQSSNIE